MQGENVGELDLSESVFGITPNVPAMHSVVVNYLANQRQGTQSTLTRAEVSGGGRKPWRQKGTGHARQGSTRAPQWYHGGVALGPKPRSYRFTLNRKLRRLAICSALSSKVLENSLTVVDSINIEEYKTKKVVAMLAALESGKKTLIVTPEPNKTLIKSAANIPGVRTTIVGSINVYDVLNCDKLIVTKDAAAKLEEVYAQ